MASNILKKLKINGQASSKIKIETKRIKNLLEISWSKSSSIEIKKC